LFEFFETHERITAKQYADLCNISERRAMRLLVRLVRIGMVFIHTHEKTAYYTLAG
jgi:predicted DNA-binding transcriptional regulator YafY